MKILDIVEFQGNLATELVLDTYSGSEFLPANSKAGQIYFANGVTAGPTPTTSNTNTLGVFLPTGSSVLRLDNIYNVASDILSNVGRGILLGSYTPASGDIIRWDASGKLTGSSLASLNLSMSLAGLSDTTITAGAQGDVLMYGASGWIDGNIVGTANQVLVNTSTVGQIVLSLPQDIATTSTPTFQGLNVLFPAGPASSLVQSTSGASSLSVRASTNATVNIGAASLAGYLKYSVSDSKFSIGVNSNTANTNAYGLDSILINNGGSASATRGAPIELGSFIKLMSSTAAAAELAYYVGTSIYKDSVSAGLMYFESGTKAVKFYDGTQWQSLLYGAGGGYIAGITGGIGVTVSGTSNITVNAPITGDPTKGLTVAQSAGAATTLTLAQNITTTGTPTFGSLTLTSQLTLNGQILTASATPSLATDVITLAYLQNQSFGTRDFKESVFVATTSALPASNVVGSVITDSTAGSVLTIDGLAMNASNNVIAGKTRVLVKNQATPSQNGIYIVTTIGVAGTVPWVLTRASDFNTMSSNVSGQTLPNISNGSYVFVGAGSTLARTGWVVNDADSALTTVNTSAINFIQFTGAGSILGTANRITVTGNTINIASNYIGQSSITTVGTIVTGVWNGTTIAIANGGTGATTALDAFNNLSPMNTLGDLLSDDGTNAVRVAGNITTTKQFLSQTGTGTVSALPAWSALAASDIPVLDVSKLTSGILPVIRGGTGLASYVIGDIIIATATTTLGRLADVAVGNALISGGVGVAPSWGKIGLTTHVSGILAFANGGTGIGSSAGAADAGKTIVLNASGNGFVLSSTKVAKNQIVTWNPSTTAATSLTVGPYIGSYQYVVAHTLASATVAVTIIDNSTGEMLLCTSYATATLNIASPVYANTTNITLKFSASGWASISAKTNLSIMLTTM